MTRRLRLREWGPSPGKTRNGISLRPDGLAPDRAFVRHPYGRRPQRSQRRAGWPGQEGRRRPVPCGSSCPLPS
eukprot:5264153-Heterocapsa_arctica.AAC.1